MSPVVGVILGSKSDLPLMEACVKVLDELGPPQAIADEAYAGHPAPAATRGTPGAVYNIGGGSRIELLDAFELIRRITWAVRYSRSTFAVI